MDEKALVKSAKLGDKDAFCQLYMAYNSRLYRYAYYKLGNPYDAQDAVSDCIVEAFTNIHTLKNEGAFSSWMFKILYRCVCSSIKMQSASNRMDDVEDSNASYDISYESAELKEALDRLSAEEQDIVLLSIVGGYSSKDISDIMGIKPATIRSKQSRALSKMKSFLE